MKSIISAVKKQLFFDEMAKLSISPKISLIDEELKTIITGLNPNSNGK
jgi:hypothetical protein